MKGVMQIYPGGKKNTECKSSQPELQYAKHCIVDYSGKQNPFLAHGILSCLCFELDHNLEQGCPIDVSAMMEIFCILNTLPGPIWQP